MIFRHDFGLTRVVVFRICVVELSELYALWAFCYLVARRHRLVDDLSVVMKMCMLMS